MPRRKKTVIELEDEPEKDTQLEDGDNDIQEALKSVPGGVSSVKLYRLLPQGGRPKFLTEMSPDMFSEANVQDMYGGGIYKIRARKADGKWGGHTFEIEGSPKRVLVDEEDEEETPMPSQIHMNPQPQPTPQPFLDPMALFAMMQKQQEIGEARMLKLMELMRPQQQSPDVTKQVFEIVEKIAPMMSGGEGGGSPWMMALTQFKDPILKIVDSIQMALTRQPMPPSGPPPQGNPPQPAIKQEEDMVGLLIRQALPVLVNGATKNADPALYADMILDQVPESAYPKLIQWLQSPGCLEHLCTIEPGIRFQQEWWMALRTSLLEALSNANTPIQPPDESTESV